MSDLYLLMRVGIYSLLRCFLFLITPTTLNYSYLHTRSLHDALPISSLYRTAFLSAALRWPGPSSPPLSIFAKIASSARLIAVWVRTISTLGHEIGRAHV